MGSSIICNVKVAKKYRVIVFSTCTYPEPSSSKRAREETARARLRADRTIETHEDASQVLHGDQSLDAGLGFRV